jgi:hypothetical protein
MITNLFKDWTMKVFLEYLVIGLVLALVISLIHTLILPILVKLIPGTLFAGTVSLTDILLFLLLLLTVAKK